MWQFLLVSIYNGALAVLADLTGKPSQQQQLCGPAVQALTRKPRGLLMVHAVLTLAVKVWVCGMTCVEADPAP